MSDDIQFVGSVNVQGIRYAKFSMNMGGMQNTFQQSVVQLRESIAKMRELKKPAERIATFQQGLDAIDD